MSELTFSDTVGTVAERPEFIDILEELRDRGNPSALLQKLTEALCYAT
jgi:hypothetical protein